MRGMVLVVAFALVACAPKTEQVVTSPPPLSTPATNENVGSHDERTSVYVDEVLMMIQQMTADVYKMVERARNGEDVRGDLEKLNQACEQLKKMPVPEHAERLGQKTTEFADKLSEFCVGYLEYLQTGKPFKSLEEIMKTTAEFGNPLDVVDDHEIGKAHR